MDKSINLGINKMDIIQQYIDIAFADICDYIGFRIEEVIAKEKISKN